MKRNHGRLGIHEQSKSVHGIMNSHQVTARMPSLNTAFGESMHARTLSESKKIHSQYYLCQDDTPLQLVGG